jgi:hypothetical protein
LNTHLHQIYYLPSQLPLLEPAFTPYDNTANENREFAEYYIFEKEYNAGRVKDDALTGFVSWKFGQKTKLTGRRFLDFVQANPGYDVYFINPFPMQMKFFKNLWLQGEFYHPGILALSQEILRLAGYDIDLAGQTHDKQTALYCNYWVGSKRFWDIYMHFTRPIIEVLRSGLSDAQKQKLHSIADKGNDFSFIAFIIERLFTTLLHHDSSIRSLAYPHSYSDIRRKYGHAGALLYKAFPDNSRLLNFAYTALRR